MRHTDQTKAKLSEMRRGERNPFFGKRHSDEFRRQQSERTRAFNAKRQYEAAPQQIVVPTDVAILGYLAGMIDADGSIRFRRQKHPFVCIYNTHEPLLDWLRATLRYGSIYRVSGNVSVNGVHLDPHTPPQMARTSC